MTEQRGYLFQNSTAEDERLLAQGKVFDPLTRRLFREAGLAPGMRVLDLGSGAGNVALLAAELVGPGGAVVGVERDPGAADRAQRRARAAGLATVEFRAGDVQTLDGVNGPFDAVVGRLILPFVPDPAGALRRAAALAGPGALICMHEADLHYLWASPQTPLWRRVRGWFLDTMEKAGIEQRMGPALYTMFRAAGLPGPAMLMETFVEGGPQAPVWPWANAVAGAVPLMERLGVATADDVGPETLAERLLAELTAADGATFGPPMIGAWCRLPA